MNGLPNVSDITYFTSEGEHSGRSTNDHNNKERENIICNMAHIGEEYTSHPQYGEDWQRLKASFDQSLKLICPVYCRYTIAHKAGRKYNYDYLVSFFDENNGEIAKEKLEFKFNAATIDDAPQFVSPMKPSQYMSASFEEYYYDNYLVNLLQKFGLDVPEREIFLKTIHGNKPACMKAAQLLYYQGCKQSSKYTDTEQAVAFYTNCIETSRECITNFIGSTELNIEKLTQYLLESQDKKNYLLYKNGGFHIQTPNTDEYIIDSYSRNPEKNRFDAITKTNKHIKILLRWKNGNGIAYPAFQIS